MKNKFLMRIIGAALGLSMAVGVGVAVSSGDRAIRVKAESVEYSFSITTSDFNSTSYKANNNEKTTTATGTTDSTKTIDVKWTSNQVMLQSNAMQWQKNTGYIYNSTDLGTIKSVNITKTDGSFTTKYGTSENGGCDSSTVGNGFFKITVGNATGKTTLITVTFEVSSASHTHKWDDGEVTTQPTCTETGVKTYHCTEEGCDETKTETIDALGHNYGDWTVDTAATCTTAGSRHHTCSRCNNTEDEEIPATGHTYVDHVCSVCGAKEPLQVTFNIATLASNNSWSNGTAYTPVVISPITLEGKGGGNNAKYYSSNNSWRMYSGGTVRISADVGYSVVSVTSNPSKTFTVEDGVATLLITATTEFKEFVVTYEEVEVEKYTVSFNGNSATGNMDSVEEVLGSYTLPDNGFNVPSGTRFAGWKAGDSEGFSGELIEAGSSYTVEADVTFWAQWVSISTISFNGNGASGSMTGTTVDTGSSYTLPANGFTVPSGKAFGGWKAGDSEGFSGDLIAAGADYTVDGNTVFWAQWSDIYTVSFNGNGAEGTMTSVTSGASYTLPANGYEVPSGKQFAGWKVENAGETLTAGSPYTLTEDITLYAQWEDRQNLGGLVSDEYYFLIVGGHVLKAGSFENKGADTYTTANSSTTGLLLSDAWYFTSTGTDDQWYIRTSNTDGASYLGVAPTKSDDNNAVCSTSTQDSWNVSENNDGDLILEDVNYERHLSYTTNSGSYIRAYLGSSTVAASPITFVKYVAPEITITGKTSEYTDTAVELTSSAGVSTSWAITTDENEVGSLNTDSGASVELSVTGVGLVTVTASATGYVSKSITVEFTERPSYYISLSGSAQNGTSSLGIKGKGVTVSVTDKNLQGTNITWTVTAGQVSNGSGDATGYTGTFNSTGTVTIVATDNGNENNTASITFTVIEELGAINAYTESQSKLAFTAACGGSGTTDDSIGWTIASDGDESAYDPGKGIHYGTGKAAVQYITLTSDESYSNINKVVVNASVASNVTATVSVTVGGNAFGGAAQSLSATATDYTFTGAKASGAVVVTITKGSSSTGALYCKSVSVDTASSTASNVANTNAAVQQEVLSFVSTMNSDLSVCSGTSTLDTSVWSGLATKFETAAKASTNETLFRQMFKYADATPRAGDGSATTGDTLQNALARYNYVLEKYGTTNYADFLHRAEADKVTPKVSGANSLFNIVSGENANNVAIIAIISMLSLASIGGYFFLRKRKEY